MLPRPLRLDLRHIPDFFAQADRLYGPVLSFRLLSPTDSVRTARWAIIVSKAVGRGAQRSQIKRRVRHALIAWLRQQSPDFTLPQSVVVLVRKSVTQAEYEQAFAQLLPRSSR